MRPPVERLEIDPYANDSGRLGVALVNLAELLLPCLDVAAARSVAEIGAYAGDLTGFLLDWARRSSARVTAIDPAPQPELEELASEHPELELVRARSLEALERIELPDVVIVDGDHNYYTVSQELRLIGERSPAGRLPLLLLHDVCWPHGRRDDYFAPALVPAEQRQPIAHWGGLHPDEPGLHDEGILYRWPAAREGGPRNGVLTAVEDFIAERGGLELAVVPAFFGLAVVWPGRAAYAGRLRELLALWDRNPLLARLERNRVRHLARARHLVVATETEADRAAAKDELLRRLSGSRTFALACRISALRRRGKPAFSDEDLHRALA